MAATKSKLVFAACIFLLIAGISYGIDSALESTPEEFTFVEGDLVKIEPVAEDPDKDKILIYFFSPLNKNGEWQTTTEDAGTYQTKIVVSDGKSETERKITLIIKNKNQPPEIEEQEIVVWENELIDLAELVSDPDDDELSLVFEEPFDLNGTWTPSYDDSGEYTVSITASDSEFKETGTVKITVKDKNSPPEIDFGEGEWVVGEKELLELNFEEFISDPEGDTFSVSIENLPLGAVLESNLLEWQPDANFIPDKNNLFTYLLSRLRLKRFFYSQHQMISLDVTACDKELCASQVLDIKVLNINQKPVLEELGDVIVSETEILSLSPTASDPDDSKLKYRFNEPLNSKGIWKTSYGDAGNYTTKVTVSDGKTSDTKEINILVKKKNRPPVFEVKDDYFKLNEGQPLTLKVTASDPDDDALEISVSDLPEGASFKDQIFSWTPSFDTVTERKPSMLNNFYARYPFLNQRFNKEYQQFVVSFIAFDGEFSVVHPVLVTVKNLNRAPEIVDHNPKNQIVATVNKPVSFSADAFDADGDGLSYEWSFGLWDGTVAGTADLQRVFITPGIKNVEVKISDGISSVKQEWLVKVNPDPSAVKKTVPDKIVLLPEEPKTKKKTEEKVEEVVKEETKEEPKKEIEKKQVVKPVEKPVEIEKKEPYQIPPPPSEPVYRVYVVEW